MIRSTIVILFLGYVSSASVIDPEALQRDIDERIWLGFDAAAGQFPYQALLYSLRSDGNYSFCGGSLVKTDIVLTAAHCCVNVNVTSVFLGMYQIKDFNSSWVQRIEVSSSGFVIHPQYNVKTISNDICILKLPTQAQLNSNVSLVALPAQDSNPSQYDFKWANISGWGQTNDLENIHPQLEYSRVIIKPHTLCKFYYILFNSVTNSQMCSGKIPWTGPCHGDSGGPLTVQDSSGKPVEIGLVSWGMGSCSSFNPVVFTYVPYYRDWLQSVMA